MPAPYGHSAQWRPSTSVDGLVDLAYAHFAAGRFSEAERGFRGVLAVEPRHAECLNGLGLLAHQCGHHQAAIALIGQAIAINGRIATYHYNIGLAFAGLGRMDEVVKHNRRAVALKPDYADAHTNLAGLSLPRAIGARRCVTFAVPSRTAQIPRRRTTTSPRRCLLTASRTKR